ncbi:microtubule-associated protein 1B-like [Cotesia glomerata]|nr:microtubule-associated protein 1B-like [Cotesia glomerata]
MMKSETSEKLTEEQERVLYVRLPHTIKNVDQVQELFVGDFKVKLPRKSGRHCHVIFSNIEEKMTNLKAIKDKLINGKRIVAYPPKVKSSKDIKIKPDKKVVIPIPKKPAKKLTRILFVCNINPVTKLHEVQTAFEGVKTITFIKGPIKNTKQAIVKLEDAKVAAEYLTKERPAPILHGHKLVIKADTRKQNKKKKSPGLKMWDGEVDITDKVAFKDSKVKNTKKKNKNNKKDTVPVLSVTSEEIDAESGLKVWDGEADITEVVEFKDKAPVKKTRKIKQS